MIQKSKNKKTILVIEDERPLIQVISSKLEKVGFEVITSRTVNQGLQYMKDVESIDAVWLDHYLLGEKTGLDFVAKLKSPTSKWKNVPIFVVSNTASEGHVQSYIRLGVTLYSVKSDHRIDEIANDIKSFLNKPKE